MSKLPYAYKQTAVFRKCKILDPIVRVNHAGEFGADRIYAGQHLVLKNKSIGSVVQRMWSEEQEHLIEFEKLIIERRVRPSALLGVWNLAGYFLGAGTAALGNSSAMACTVAVERVITDHYNDQIRELMIDNSSTEKELISVLKKFRDDEQDHHDTGLHHDAEQMPFYKYFMQVISAGCVAAVKIAKIV